jgi:hypothetical protein
MGEIASIFRVETLFFSPFQGQYFLSSRELYRITIRYSPEGDNVNFVFIEGVYYILNLLLIERARCSVVLNHPANEVDYFHQFI